MSSPRVVIARALVDCFHNRGWDETCEKMADAVIDALVCELEAEVERLTQLLANVFDNLNDLPIGDEWARLTCDRISAALGVANEPTTSRKDSAGSV